MFAPSVLWKAPVVNPINQKARSIPVFNVINMYGRVFFFSWFGFFVAFWSWYAFPPLLKDTIGKDLKLTKIDIANSNIVALCATLLVRLVAGPCCDRFGPRMTFIGCLLIGSIPTFLAGTCYTKSQLFACRFFVGILGGSFVPCQVWSTAFFDKNIVGTSNALIGGWGNAGGGVTYFLMPTIYDSLVSGGYTPHVAWRVTFIVPGVVIVFTAACLFFLCEDTPTGKWADRHLATQQALEANGVHQKVIDAPTGGITEKGLSSSGTASPAGSTEKVADGEHLKHDVHVGDKEAQLTQDQMIETAKGEIVVKPTWGSIIRVMTRPQTLAVAFCYFFSFGAELAINSTLGTYYQKNFPKLGQTKSGQWAAMFGLLNVITRPIGGVVADILYKIWPNVWVKKIWIHTVGIIAGAFLIAIGLTDPHSPATMFTLIGFMAGFLEAGNGANFALVPHVNPSANGIVSGMTGATGNFGGVMFAIVFRYMHTDYAKAFWIIGVCAIAINVCAFAIPPVSKKQIGGR